MYQRIVVPLDGSKRAERAIPPAALLARRSHGSLTFMRVVLPPVDTGKYVARQADMLQRRAFEKEKGEAASYLVNMMLSHSRELAGISADMGVASGLVAPTMFSVARSQHADLIIMCSHGETGLKRRLFGSVALEAARHSPVTTLVLHEHCAIHSTLSTSNPEHPLRILVPLDGTTQSETALEAATQLVTTLASSSALTATPNATLHLLRVVTVPTTEWLGQTQLETTWQEAETYLQTVKQRLCYSLLAPQALSVTSSVVFHSNVAGAILKEVEQSGDYDLIAMAAHEHAGRLHHLIGGSVIEHILGYTALPLLVVRPCETARQTSLARKRGRKLEE